MKIQLLKIDPKLKPLLNVIQFAILILVFHFTFRYWSSFHYWPIREEIDVVFNYLSDLLYNNSVWVLENFTSYNLEIDDSSRTISLGPGSLFITTGCSGLKQFLQWIVLMFFFAGPWKQKLWFIPVGVLILHIYNVIRIVCLCVNFEFFPQYWNFLHYYFFRYIFYVVIFGLWLLWVEKIIPSKVK
jgi:exosortase/archaeosortase family protein